MKKILNAYIILTLTYVGSFMLLLLAGTGYNILFLLDHYFTLGGFLIVPCLLTGFILLVYTIILRIRKKMEGRTFRKYALLLALSILSAIILTMLIVSATAC